MSLPPDPHPSLTEYAHPERLVTADWLSANMGAPGLAIVSTTRRPISGLSCMRRPACCTKSPASPPGQLT